MRGFIIRLTSATMFVLLPSTMAQAQTLDQKKPDVFAMGVNFGIASYFASVAATASPTDPNRKVLLENVSRALRHVQVAAGNINGAKDLPNPTFLDTPAMSYLDSDFNNVAGVPAQLYPMLVAMRDGITAKFAQLSKPITHAYVLGVNLGIAEGFATRDDQRQTVHTALMNARSAAQNLNLDLGPLDVCIALASGTSTPMSEIHLKIVSVRSTFQSSF